MITKLGITIIKTRPNIHITDTYCKTARTYYFLKSLTQINHIVLFIMEIKNTNKDNIIKKNRTLSNRENHYVY